MKVKKIDIEKAVYVLVMIFVLNINYSLFHVSSQVHYIIVHAFSILCLVQMVQTKKSERKYFYELLRSYFLPLMAVTFLSVITAIMVWHTSVQGDYTQSIRRLFFFFEAALIAFSLYKKFGKNCLQLIVLAGFIAYTTVIIQWIAQMGIRGILHPFMRNSGGISLEIHEFTYICAMCLIYTILSTSFTKTYKIKMGIVLLVAVFLGNKRAIYLAMALSLLVYFGLHKFDNRRKQLLRFITVLYFIAAFIWLYLIKSGILYAVCAYYGINSSSRFTFWNYFAPSYDLSINFWGRGIAYTSNVMATDAFRRPLMISISTELHNDILRTYIGWGFIPFIIYYYNFIVLQLKKVSKIVNDDGAWAFFSIVSYIFFVYIYT